MDKPYRIYEDKGSLRTYLLKLVYKCKRNVYSWGFIHRATHNLTRFSNYLTYALSNEFFGLTIVGIVQ